MSTETNPNGAQPAPAAPVQPAIQPPASLPPAAPSSQPDDKDPPWLPERLARAQKSATKEGEEKGRKALLAELGIDDPEVVKKLVVDKKRRDEEQKSLEQKFAEREAKLAEYDAKLKQYHAATASLANEQLAALPEDRKAVVLKLAGDDPAKQLETIATLRPTWAALTQTQDQRQQSQDMPQGSSAPTAQPPQVAPAKPAAPTGPAANAPSPAGTHIVANHLETYEYLLQHNPFVAADYYQANYAAIVEAKQKRSA